MSEPKWAKVLSTLYEEEIATESLNTEELPEDHTLVTETEYSASRIEETLSYLQQIGLIENTILKRASVGDSEESEFQQRTISLTDDGFQVAHERAMSERQRKHEQEQTTRQNSVNTAIAALTLILAFATIVQASAAVVSLPETNTPLLLLLLLVAILMGFIQIQLYRAGLFDFESIAN